MNWLHLLMTGGTGMILGTAGGIGYYRIADPEKCRDWRILEVLVAAGLFLVGIDLVVGSALGVLGFLIQRYGHPSEIATAGMWIAELAIPAGGFGIAYHAIMAQYDPGVHLRRMGQVAWVTGGVVLVGLILQFV